MSAENDEASQYDPDRLEAFASEILEAAGLQSGHAATVSEALVAANLRGIDTHGVVRLEPYLKHLRDGGINPEPALDVDQERRSAVVVDGDDGPGQVAALEAMEATIAAAERTGVAVTTVRNSNHFGTAGYYTRKAAEQGCIAFAMTNVASEVVPYGGTEPYFGTNPLAYSVPTDRPYAITLDMATSVAALGKIILAEAEGEPIPEEWAIDDNGQPTTDPTAVHALRPLGGPKGYGLAMLVDICSGPLAGMPLSPAVGNLFDRYDEPQGVGHFFGAVDVTAFRALDDFLADVDTMIESLKRQDPQPGFDEVKLPGEIEYETRQRRSTTGIPIGAGVGETLRGLAREFGVTFPSPM